MLKKEYEDLYISDKSQINRDVRTLEELKQGRGWQLVIASLNELIDKYRDELETVNKEKLIEIQYATQNLKELRNIPDKLIEYIKRFEVNSDAPPSEHLGFDYKD
jgi:hypothetical protein